MWWWSFNDTHNTHNTHNTHDTHTQTFKRRTDELDIVTASKKGHLEIVKLLFSQDNDYVLTYAAENGQPSTVTSRQSNIS